MVCAPVRSMIPELKLGDYLAIQAHKPCSPYVPRWRHLTLEPYIILPVANDLKSNNVAEDMDSWNRNFFLSDIECRKVHYVKRFTVHIRVKDRPAICSSTKNVDVGHGFL